MIKFWLAKNHRSLMQFTGITVGLSFLFTTISAPFAAASNSSIWEERRQALKEKSDMRYGIWDLSKDKSQKQTPEKLLAMASVPQFQPAAIKNFLTHNPYPTSHISYPIPKNLWQAIAPYGEIASSRCEPWAVSYELQKSISHKAAQSTQLKAQSMPLVIHIQDAHNIYSTQKNIALMLSQLSALNPQLIVGAEGSEGAFQGIEKWRSYPDQDSLVKASEYLMKGGFLTGVEIAALKQKGIELYGVEEKDTYLSQVQSFKSSLGKTKEIESWELRVERQINDLKEKYYSQELKQLDAVKKAYEKGEKKLGEYLTALSNMRYGIWVQGKGNVVQFLKSYQLEQSLNYKQVEQEQTTLLKALARKLTQKELKELVEISLAYRLGQIGYVEFYGELKQRCQKAGVLISPEMSKYMEYVFGVDRINKEQLFTEIMQLEDEPFSKGEEQRVYKLAKDFSLLKKALDFTLTPQEYQQLIKRQTEIAAIFRIPSAVQDVFNSVIQFNQLSDKRSKIFVDKLLKSPDMRYEKWDMSNSKTNRSLKKILTHDSYPISHIAVLIAGGYHSAQIETELKKRGISFITVRPQMDTADIQNPTHPLEAFKRDLRPLEKTFLPEKVTLAPSHALGSGFNGAPQSVQEAFKFSAEAIHEFNKNPSQTNQVYQSGYLRAYQIQPKNQKIRENLLDPAFVASEFKTLFPAQFKGEIIYTNEVDDQLIMAITKEHPFFQRFRSYVSSLMQETVSTVNWIYEIDPLIGQENRKIAENFRANFSQFQSEGLDDETAWTHAATFTAFQFTLEHEHVIDLIQQVGLFVLGIAITTFASRGQTELADQVHQHWNAYALTYGLAKGMFSQFVSRQRFRKTPVVSGQQFHKTPVKFYGNAYLSTNIKVKKTPPAVNTSWHTSSLPRTNLAVKNDNRIQVSPSGWIRLHHTLSLTPKQKAPLLGFSDLRKYDTALAGGKGANLGELRANKIPVPNGFVVTAQGYQNTLAQNNDQEEIEKILAETDVNDPEQLQSAEQKIQSLIKSRKLSGPLTADLLKEFDALAQQEGFNPNEIRVAVRSSATQEDKELTAQQKKELGENLTAGSSAGQQTTYLYVRRSQVPERVMDCFASLFNANAISYRDRQGLVDFMTQLDPQTKEQLLQELLKHGDTKTIAEQFGKEHVSRIQLRKAIQQYMPELLQQFDKAYEPYINPYQLSLAVVIQRMVQSDASFTIFSYDPATRWTGLSFDPKSVGSPAEGRIFKFEVLPGLGEGVVQGISNTDMYVVHIFKDENGKEQINFLDKICGTKERQFIHVDRALSEIRMSEKHLMRLVQLMQSDRKGFFNAIEKAKFQEALASLGLTINQVQSLEKEIEKIHKLKLEAIDAYLEDSTPLPGLEGLILNRSQLVRLADAVKARLEDPKINTMVTFVPKELRNQFTISDDQAREIVRTAKQATDFYGNVRDMEGAIEKDKVSLVQSRAITTPTELDSSIIQLTKRVVDEDDAGKAEQNGQLLVTGVPGRHASAGKVFFLDKDSGHKVYEEQVHALLTHANEAVKQGTGIVVVVRATEPHDEIWMKHPAVSAYVTFDGGDTSHAAIISRELGKPGIFGIRDFLNQLKSQKPVQHENIHQALHTNGTVVTVDANSGKVYLGVLPIKTQHLEIDGARMPKLQTKVGLIAANDKSIREVSKLGSYRDFFYGISLARAEFRLVEIGVHPRALEAYDNMKKLEADPDLHLTERELNDVKKLKANPILIRGIEDKIRGYASAVEYFIEKLSQGIGSMAAAVGLQNKLLYRFNDFKQNELNKILGGPDFGMVENASMIGDRGIGWELKEENKTVLGMEMEALKRAYQRGYKNVRAFFPFVRTPDELKEAVQRFENLGMPLDEIGVMIELPSNVVQAREYAVILAEFQKRTGKKVFFSFGTNDLTQLTLWAGREEPGVKELFRESHPAIIESLRYVVQTVHSVRKEYSIKDENFTCGLCGQAIIKLLEADPESAGEIIAMLDSVGVDVLAIAKASRMVAQVELERSEIRYENLEALQPLVQGKSNMNGSAARKITVIRSFSDLSKVYTGDFVVFDRHFAVDPYRDVNIVDLKKLQAALDRVQAESLDKNLKAMAQKIKEQLSASEHQRQSLIRSPLFKKLSARFLIMTAIDQAGAVIADSPGFADFTFLVQNDIAINPSRELSMVKPYLSINEGLDKLILKDSQVVTIDFSTGKVYDRQLPVRKVFPQAKGEGFVQQIFDPQEPQGVEVHAVNAGDLYQQYGEYPAHDLENFKAFIRGRILNSAQQAKQNGQTLIYRTSDLTTAQYRELKGGKEHADHEDNPPIGLSGVFRFLKKPHDLEVLKAEVDVLLELKQNELKDIEVGLEFTDVRDLSHLNAIIQKLSEDRNLKALKIGMRADNPVNYLLVREFVKELNFISIDWNKLAARYFAADLDNSAVASHITPEVIEKNLFWAVNMIKDAAARAGIRYYETGKGQRTYRSLQSLGSNQKNKNNNNEKSEKTSSSSPWDLLAKRASALTGSFMGIGMLIGVTLFTLASAQESNTEQEETVQKKDVYQLSPEHYQELWNRLNSIDPKTNTPYASQIKEIWNQRKEALDQGDIKKVDKLDKQIEQIIEQINAIPADLGEYQAIPKELDPIHSHQKFEESNEYSQYRRLARQAILNGLIGFHLVFAGAATRLGLGPMYNVDLIRTAQIVLDIPNGSISSEERVQVKQKFSEYIKEKNLNEQGEINKLHRIYKQIPTGSTHLTLAQRQLWQYRYQLEQLAIQDGLSPQDAKSKIFSVPIVMHVNDEFWEDVKKDFIKNNFYGFNPEWIFFTKPTLTHPYQFDDSVLKVDQQGGRLPIGHGEATLLLYQTGRAIQLDKNGKEIRLQKSLDEILIQKTDKLVYHRINDLTLLTGVAIDEDWLAYTWYQMDQGHHIVAELVGNPSKQKGGNVVYDTQAKQAMLVETLNTNGSPQLNALLGELAENGAPYNKFSLAVRLSGIKPIAQSGFPVNVRYIKSTDGDRSRNGFTIELVTGDLTQDPRAKAVFFQQGTQSLINDFKEFKNLPAALKAVAQQEKDPDFQEFLKRRGVKSSTIGADHVYKTDKGWTESFMKFLQSVVKPIITMNEGINVSQNTSNLQKFVESPMIQNLADALSDMLSLLDDSWTIKADLKALINDIKQNKSLTQTTIESVLSIWQSLVNHLFSRDAVEEDFPTQAVDDIVRKFNAKSSDSDNNNNVTIQYNAEKLKFFITTNAGKKEVRIRFSALDQKVDLAQLDETEGIHAVWKSKDNGFQIHMQPYLSLYNWGELSSAEKEVLFKAYSEEFDEIAAYVENRSVEKVHFSYHDNDLVYETKDKIDSNQQTLIQKQAEIKNGLTMDLNNPVQGTIVPIEPKDSMIVNLTDEKELEEFSKCGKDIPTVFSFSAGGLSSRGGGLFTARYTFPSNMPPGLAGESFTSIKLAEAKKANAPMVIMTSPLRLDAVADALNLDQNDMKIQIDIHGFARYVVEGIHVYVYVQGLQKRIVPQEIVLLEYYQQALVKKKRELEEKKITEQQFEEYSKALWRGIEDEKGKAGEILLKKDGSPAMNPAGHWDFIRYLALSGLLAELERKHVRYVFHSNLNNPSASLDDYLKGAFDREIEKARKEGRPEPVSMFLLGENRGEKGGLLVKVKLANGEERMQLVEGIALTKEARAEIDQLAKIDESNKNHDKLKEEYPYFSTASFLLNVEGLMKLFNLEPNYDKILLKEEIEKRVDLVTQKLPVYMDLKEEPETLRNGSKRILVGYQLERIFGDITTVVPWVPAVINRDDHFVPVKELNDLKKTADMKRLADKLKNTSIYNSNNHNNNSNNNNNNNNLNTIGANHVYKTPEGWTDSFKTFIMSFVKELFKIANLNRVIMNELVGVYGIRLDRVTATNSFNNFKLLYTASYLSNSAFLLALKDMASLLDDSWDIKLDFKNLIEDLQKNRSLTQSTILSVLIVWHTVISRIFSRNAEAKDFPENAVEAVVSNYNEHRPQTLRYDYNLKTFFIKTSDGEKQIQIRFATLKQEINLTQLAQTEGVHASWKLGNNGYQINMQSYLSLHNWEKLSLAEQETLFKAYSEEFDEIAAYAEEASFEEVHFTYHPDDKRDPNNNFTSDRDNDDNNNNNFNSGQSNSNLGSGSNTNNSSNSNDEIKQVLRQIPYLTEKELGSTVKTLRNKAHILSQTAIQSKSYRDLDRAMRLHGVLHGLGKGNNQQEVEALLRSFFNQPDLSVILIPIQKDLLSRRFEQHPAIEDSGQLGFNQNLAVLLGGEQQASHLIEEFLNATAQAVSAVQKATAKPVNVQELPSAVNLIDVSEMNQGTGKTEQIAVQIKKLLNVKDRQGKSPVTALVSNWGAHDEIRKQLIEVDPELKVLLENTPILIQHQLNTDAIYEILNNPAFGLRIWNYDETRWQVGFKHIHQIQFVQELINGQVILFNPVEAIQKQLREALIIHIHA